jgi:hypothetical protein
MQKLPSCNRICILLKHLLLQKKKKALCDSNFKIGKDEDESVPDLFLVTTFLLEL